MANITLTLPEDLREEIKRHKEVNWSAIMRNAVQDHLRKMHIAEAIAQKSKLTQKDVEEIDKLIKKGIAKAHGLE
jgi:Arc/MetJ-type ribon-helix-helix transcriptional regulator